MAVLIQIDGYDPVDGAAVTLRAASVDDARVCHLDGQVWWPALASLPALREVRFDGGFGGAIETPSSAFTLAAEPWPLFARYALADARVRIWVGDAGAAWAAWTLRFDGRVTAQPGVADGLAQVSIMVDARWLDKPLLALYAGTGGAEGEAGLKGQPKPLALGRPRYVPGVMIDAVHSVIQLSAYGAIEDVEVAMERVVRFAASAGDYASHAALVAATIPAGRWATCKAEGKVRHGAPPVGLLSYHLKGDTAGPDGWARLPGSLIRRIALLGGGAGRIDDASLSALDAARPWPLSLHQAAQTTARELIQRIAAGVNAVARVDWLGKLVVDPIALGTPSQVLDATGATLPAILSVEQAAVDAPWWQLAIGAEPSWAVHALSDVAFSAVLVPRGLLDLAETYREGHIVDLQDGSSWLYINPVPSSGHAPPSIGTEDSWWKRLLGPRAYADGTPIEDLKPAEPGATEGAPPGTNVGGVPSEVVISDRLVTGETLIDQALNHYSQRQRVMAMLHLNGRPIRAIAEIVTEARVDELGNAFARAGFEVDANGIIGGLFLTSDGRLVDFRVAADKFQIIRPGTAGTDPDDILLSVEGTTTRLHDVEVDSIKARTVTPPEMDEGATGERALVQDATGVTVTSTSAWQDIASVSITPKYGNPILIDFTMWMRASASTSTFLYVRVVRDDGTAIYGGGGGLETHVIDEGGPLPIRCVSGAVADRPTTFTLQGKKVNNSEPVEFSERIAIADEESRRFYQAFELAGNAAGEGPTAGTGGGGAGYNPNPYERSL